MQNRDRQKESESTRTRVQDENGLFSDLTPSKNKFCLRSITTENNHLCHTTVGERLKKQQQAETEEYKNEKTTHIHIH